MNSQRQERLSEGSGIRPHLGQFYSREIWQIQRRQREDADEFNFYLNEARRST